MTEPEQVDAAWRRPDPKIDAFTRTPERLTELRRMPYDEYLRTQEWQERRRVEIKWAEYRCEQCGRRDVSLHVHHVSYDRLGEEAIDDLIVLCRDCHKVAHGIAEL